ncbi:spore wall protein 2 isoform X2 [Ipomoea triloba]|uniref:spore wall protein 2 isoform X2 n=1 Tax=Ipomoea triloba TaxID=35885 RepID=UPI00125D7C2A|nr:spore wall protein 2 isoform X2 [Ipomoea triloba]
MEESDDKDSFNPPPPSLPANYVTLTMLKERWLQKKQEEEEAKLKKQQNPEQEAKEERAGGSRDRITPTTRNQNPGKSGRDYVPRRRQQFSRDRRGGESWVRKHEEAESSGSVVVGGNPEIKEKKHWEGRKPRAPQSVKYPENAAEKGEIPTVLSEESGGKGKNVGELLLDGDNGENGVEIRKGFGGERRGERKEWRGGFKRYGNGRVNSRVHKQVGELEENEKKEEGVFGGAEEKKEKAEKGRQSGIGQSAVKIDKSSQDLLLDDRKDAIVSVRVSGQQLSMNSKVHKQAGEKEKKGAERVVGVVEDRRGKGEKGRQSGIGQSGAKIDKNSQDLLLDDRKDGNVRTGVSGQQQSKNSKVYKHVGELGEDEKKAEEGVVVVAEDRREKGEKGRQSGIGQSGVKIDKGSRDFLLDDRKDGNVRMRVSGQQQRMDSKVYKQVGELGEDEKKAEEGVVVVAEDRREKGEKGRQSGIGQSAVKIDMSSQDLLLDDRKDANVRTRVSSQQQSIDSKVHELVGEFGDEEKKVEEGVVEVAKDGIKNGDEGRIRIRTCAGPWAHNIENRFRNDNRRYGNVRRISGSAGGRHGYVGYGGRVARQRVEQVENRLMWVKKGENSSGNVTEFNSQVHL